MNYVHKQSGKVISNEAYWRLSTSERNNYTLTTKSVTHEHHHHNDSLDSFLTGVGVGMVVDSLFDDSSSSSSDFGSSDFGSSSDSFDSFGGGDFGGGGAGDSW